MSDLSTVLKIVDALEDARLRVWLFGGWAEELRGLRPPCEHSHVDFLYPGRDFARVDRFAAGDERPHKRTFELEGVSVELLLVQKDERGWYSQLPVGIHRWPADVFATAGKLPVASETALHAYRNARSRWANAA